MSAASGSSHRTSVKSLPTVVQTDRRARVLIDLSRSRRAESHSKRRRGVEVGADAATPAPVAVTPEEATRIISSFTRCFDLTTGEPNSQIEPAERHSALAALRHMLSADEPPIGMVVDSGVVPLLVSELRSSSSSSLPSAQLDALWCLTNIASGTNVHTSSVLIAAPTIIALLSAASPKLVQQCVWCLGNIASGEPECRRQLLENGLLVPLIRLLTQPLPSTLPPPPARIHVPDAQRELLRVVAWTLSNLVKATRTTVAKQAIAAGATGVANENADTAKHAAILAAAMPSLLPPVLAFLRSDDDQLATECAWLLSAWANHSDEVLRQLCSHGLIESLLTRLHLIQQSPLAANSIVVDPHTGVERDTLAPILIPLVRIIGNAAYTDGEIIQAMMRVNFPPAGAGEPQPANGFHLLFSTLDRSLSSIHRGLKKEVCWVISNLAATNVEAAHRALIIADDGPSAFLRQLYDILARGNFDLQREVAHAIYNLARIGSSSTTAGPTMHIVLPRHDPNSPSGVITLRVLTSLFQFLSSRDPDGTFIALRLIELILRFHPDGPKLVEENGGIDALESVQTSLENVELVAYAQRLVDEFFGVELEQEYDETTTTETSTTNQTNRNNHTQPTTQFAFQAPNDPNNHPSSGPTQTNFQF